MNEEYRNKQFNNKGLTIYEAIIVALIIFAIILLFAPRSIPRNRPSAKLILCKQNMKHLGLTIQLYADDNSGSYPLPEKWYDLVSPYLGDLADKAFHCPAVKEYKYHYAMNPNCKPNSPPDTVLLFETQNSDWNLSGGPELLTTENHKEKVCNVLFNYGSLEIKVEGIKKEEIPNLKWNMEK